MSCQSQAYDTRYLDEAYHSINCSNVGYRCITISGSCEGNPSIGRAEGTRQLLAHVRIGSKVPGVKQSSWVGYVIVTLRITDRRLFLVHLKPRSRYASRLLRYPSRAGLLRLYSHREASLRTGNIYENRRWQAFYPMNLISGQHQPLSKHNCQKKIPILHPR